MIILGEKLWREKPGQNGKNNSEYFRMADDHGDDLQKKPICLVIDVGQEAAVNPLDIDDDSHGSLIIDENDKIEIEEVNSVENVPKEGGGNGEQTDEDAPSEETGILYMTTTN